MEDENLAYIQFESEEARLRYIIAQFKKYDAKRKRHLAHLQTLNERYRNRIAELDKLTEHQHEEIDALIEAYDGAKGLIQNPSQKAWVYELIKAAAECKRLKGQCTALTNQNAQFQGRITRQKEKIEALEQVIKNLHNGKR